MRRCGVTHGGLGCSMALCLGYRNRRKVLVFTIMCCGLIWIAMFSVGFTCCAVVSIDTSRTDNVVLLQDTGVDKQNINHIRQGIVMRKKLLQDTSWQLRPDTGKHSTRKPQSPVDKPASQNPNNNEKVIYGGFLPTKKSHVGKHTSHDLSRGSVRQSDSINSRFSEVATRKLPQTIIIGVKKGGTRALLEFLRIHPNVRAPGPEIHFFDRYYHKGLEWYRRQMPPTIPGQLTVEKTPSYLITKEVPRRIYSMSKDTKLVVVVRDPVTRAISDYTQAASKRPGMKPFIQMAFLGNYTGLVNTSWGAIRIGVYAKHVDRWLKYFPLRQIHFVNGEKLITDPAGEMVKVQDFLGLKRVVNEKHFYFNETKGFPCLKKTEGSGRPHCLGKSKGRQHPVVPQQVLDRLRDFFRPFNAKLYQMVGQDFKWS